MVHLQGLHSCGPGAAALNRLCALPHVSARRAFDAIDQTTPLYSAGAAPTALLLLPIAPAFARAAANAAAPTRSPIDVLSSGVLLALIVVAAVRSLLRRSRIRGELNAHLELLKVPISELARFDALREAGDQRKLDEAWRDLVARKRADREQRISASVSVSDTSFDSLRSLDRLGDAVVERDRWTTDVKRAAAEINAQQSYLRSPQADAGADYQPAVRAYARQGGYAPLVPSAPSDRRFPPPRATYKRPTANNEAETAGASAAAAPEPPRFQPGVLAQRIARASESGRVTSYTQYAPTSAKQQLGAGTRAADMRAASQRTFAAREAARLAAEREAARSATRTETYVGYETGEMTVGEMRAAMAYESSAAAAEKAPFELLRDRAVANLKYAAEEVVAVAVYVYSNLLQMLSLVPQYARTLSVRDFGREATQLVALSYASTLALFKSVTEPLSFVPAAQAEVRSAPSQAARDLAASSWYAAAAGTPVEPPPPVYLPRRPAAIAGPRAASAPPATRAAAAVALSALVEPSFSKPPLSSWEILAAKHALLDQMAERNGGSPSAQ